MKITEIQIKNFGKLHQMSIRPLPGINVIYGENETGKSTMQQFITGMLFGLEKQRGRSGKNDSYQQYEPWNTSSYYAGALKFTVGGKSFLLERNFYHKEKSVRLVNEGDLEELSVEHGDLEMLLGGMKKETYENTYCVGQASIETKKEFAGILQNYFVNTSHSGDGGIDLVGAQKRLKDRQKAAMQAYKVKEAQNKEEEEKLRLEETLIRKDIEEMENRKKQGIVEEAEPRKQIVLEHDSNQMAEYLREMKQQKLEKEYRIWKLCSLVLGLGVAGVVLGIGKLTGMGAQNPGKLFFGIMAVLIFLTGIAGVWHWNKKEKEIRNIRLEEKKRAEGIQQVSPQEMEAKKKQERQAKQQAVKELLRSQLAEKQSALLNIQQELEECREPKEEEIELEQQIKACELALATLQQLSQNVYENTREELEQEISSILSELTSGKYDKIALDEQMNLVVREGNQMHYPWQLSRGTMEQMYMALRFGTGRVFTREESMPIILDEVFASYDEKRLESALRWLGKQPEQIFLFTCQRREMELLERNGIPYGKIMLSR